jgi:hypothetical protein
VNHIADATSWQVVDNGIQLQFYAETGEILRSLPKAVELSRPAAETIAVTRLGNRLSLVELDQVAGLGGQPPTEIWLSAIHDRAECSEWLPTATTALLNLNGFASLSFCFTVSTGVTDSASLACIRRVHNLVTSETRDYSDQIEFIRRIDKALGRLLGRRPLFVTSSSKRAIPRFWISDEMARKVSQGLVKIPYCLEPDTA